MMVLGVVKRNDEANQPTMLLGYEYAEDPTYPDEYLFIGIKSDEGDDVIFDCASDADVIWREILTRWGDWETFNPVFPEMTDEEYWNRLT